MKIVIIEDEKPILDTLVKIVTDYIPECEIIDTASNTTDAYMLLSEKKCDLALCDINIGEGTIFDVLRRLEDIEFKIIFITAFEEYAIKAIKFSALDYLVKPVDPLELIDAIKKAQKTITREEESLKVKTLVANINPNDSEMRRIVLKTAESIYIVSVEEIVHCQSEGSYCTFFLQDGRKIMVSKLLKEYDEILSGNNFIRVHQSFLVNVNHIDRYDKTEGGYLVMHNEQQVPVSLRKKEKVLKLIESLG